MNALTVVYDACVLYPAPLRDLLMYLTGSDSVRARWTDEIHDEWMRNLLENRPDLSRAKLERTRRQMDAYVDDCLVIGYEPLIDTLQLPDPGDRHVLAAAIKAKASLIVTTNIKDFPQTVLAPYRIQAVTPDDFVLRLIGMNPREVLELIKRQRKNMKNPPLTVEQFLAMLKQQCLSKTVAFLREHENDL